MYFLHNYSYYYSEAPQSLILFPQWIFSIFLVSITVMISSCRVAHLFSGKRRADRYRVSSKSNQNSLCILFSLLDSHSHRKDIAGKEVLTVEKKNYQDYKLQ